MSIRSTARRTRIALVAATVAAVGVASAVIVPAAVGTSAAAPSPQNAPSQTPIEVWLTQGAEGSADRLTRQADVHWGAPEPGAVVVGFDPAQTRQAITGFGASFTDSATSNVMRLDAATRAQLMTELFSRDTGIGLSILRQPLGASDFVDPRGASGASVFYTYKTATGVDVSRDQDSINLVKEAAALRGTMTVIGSPWSPPGEFRRGGSLLGSEANNDLLPAYEQAYANYLRDVVQAYADQGVGIDYLTVQNEPLHNPPYPGLVMTADQQIRVVQKLSAALTAAGSNTKILGYDHNWDIPQQGWTESSWTDPDSVNPAYPAYVLAATQDLPNVAGTAMHCYKGLPDYAGNTTLLHDRFPTTEILWTECTGTQTANTFRDTMEYHGSRTIFTALRNWSQSIVFWNMALNDDGGPVPSGGGVDVCSTCSGVVTVDNDAAQGYTKGVAYYLLGHFSKFVQPGATVVASDDVTVAMGGGNNDTGVSNAVFKNPDGTFVAVLYNDAQSLTDPAASDRRVSLTGPDGTATVTMPGNSMVTLVWGTPDEEPDDPTVPTPPTTPTVPTVPTPTAPKRITVKKKPRLLVGKKAAKKAKVGKTLRVTKGRYSVAGVKVKYRWLRGKKVIKKTNKAKFKVTKKFRNSRIRVRVTVKKPGYIKVRITTRAVRIR